MSFFAELKRRNVVKVGIAYIVAAWLLLQLTEVLTELLELNTEVGKLVIVLIIIGFIPALIFAWAFEMTPEGIKREKDVDRSQSVATHTGQKLNFAIIAMLICVAAYFVWESRFAERNGAPPLQAVEQASEATNTINNGNAARPTDERTSIVVLPFVNMSADADQEYFSDGLSEEILNALVKISDLRVISRTSAFAFKGKDMSIPEIARQLDVSHVLEGSVRTAGDSVRITAQLIEVDTDSHLWSEAYNRQLENVFDIQEEISLAIADQLQLRLASEDRQARPTDNVEAYKLFLRGRHHYQLRGEANLQVAEDLLGEATELDPGFDLAWANLAAARMISGFYVATGYRERYDSATDAANLAIEINPENGLAWATLGLLAMAEFEFETGLAHFEQAIALNPNESNIFLWKGISLLDLGYVQDAIDTFKRAEAFDPAFVNLHNWLVSAYLASGDHEAARHHVALALALEPDYEFNNPIALRLALNRDSAGIEKAMEQASNPTRTPDQRAAYLALAEALKDPAKIPQAVEALQAVEKNDWNFFTSGPLLRLGAIEEAADAWRATVEAGRKLRAFNELSFFWETQHRQSLRHPAITKLFEDHGLTDLWRKKGAPDYCRQQGTDFVCGTP